MVAIMFRTFSGNTSYHDVYARMGAAFGIGVTLATQSGGARLYPFDAPDPVRGLAGVINAVNSSSSIAMVSDHVVTGGLACGMPVAPRTTMQYGLMPAATIPSVVTTHSTWSV
jgi:hypothetical protein